METTRTANGIEYIFTRKRVKNINLRVHADGRVTVSAPFGAAAEEVDKFVASKAEFIENARRKLGERTKEDAHEYVSGEKFRLLGRELTLKIVSGEPEICAEGGELRVSLVNAHVYALRKKAVNDFFTRRCAEVFAELLERIYPEFEPYGVPCPTLKIKNMKSRWGSCTPSKGIITLNSQLIAKRMEYIEYVVMHEYCHFLEPNHSKRFYAHLSRHMPDWKQRRDGLNHGF